MQKKNLRIVLTGGHAATTALAVIEEIQKRHPDWQIHWIGVQRAFEGKKIPTLESKIFSDKENVKVHSIIAGRLQKKFTRWTMYSLLKMPIGFFYAFKLLSKIRPTAILSFGGYAAYPIVVVAWIMRIPVVIHDQTTVAGRANQKSAFFAKYITISHSTSAEYFPANKTIFTGNPVLSNIRLIKPKLKPGRPPKIFITGGSRGALSLNTLIEGGLRDLLKNYEIVHLTGQIDFEKFKHLREGLESKLRDRYQVLAFVYPDKMSKLYNWADIVIARSGANTVSEVIVTKRPAIFIPLPWLAHNEQYKNAEYAQEFGLARIIDQDADAGELIDKVSGIFANYEKITAEVKDKVGSSLDAHQKLVTVLEKVMTE